MTAIGGSIESVGLDGRTFPVDAEGDSSRKLGGFENETPVNGNGSTRQIKKRIPASFGGLVLSIDDDNGDQEYIQGLANANGFFPCVVTLVSGKSYRGLMQITGEISFSTQNATATISLSGGLLEAI